MNWFVCHTKSRCEKKFAALLEVESFDHYLPLVESVKRYEGRTKRFSKPLFPGYVFAQLAPEHKARVFKQDLLVRTIPVADVPKFQRQIQTVRTLVASGYEITRRPHLKKGTPVKVISGPLWGVEGIVDDPANPKGIIILIDVLQEGLHVRVAAEHLEPIA